MKTIIYKIGFAAVAMMALTSFNPLSHTIRLASLEGSTSLAQVAATEATIIKDNYEGTFATGYKVRPGKGFTFELPQNRRRYLIESVTPVAVGSTTSETIDLDKLGTTSATPSQNMITVNACVREVSGTIGQVCTNCGQVDVSIPQICTNFTLDTQKLATADTATINSLKAQLSEALKQKIDEVADEEEKRREMAEKCEYTKEVKLSRSERREYGEGYVKDVPDYEKNLKCARDRFADNEDSPELRRRYANLFKKIAKDMIEAGKADPKDFARMLEDVDPSSVELISVMEFSTRYAQLMEPNLQWFDPYRGTWQDVSLPQFYEKSQANLILQYNQCARSASTRSLCLTQLKISSQQLESNYYQNLMGILGQPGIDSYGVNGSDYREILSPYIMSSPFAALGSRYGMSDSYKQLIALMRGSNRGIRSGIDPLNTSVFGPDWLDSSNNIDVDDTCYDQLLVSSSLCLDSNTGNGRLAGNLASTRLQRSGLPRNSNWNSNSWLNASQPLSSLDRSNIDLLF